MTDLDVSALGELDTALFTAFMTPEGQADPYPHYAVVREATAVHLAFGGGPYVFTRYDDCMKALRDPRFGQSQNGPKAHELFGLTEDDFAARFPRFRELPESLLGLNPPDHTRIRGLVSKAFTPKTVEALRPNIIELADSLLDRMEGTCDVMSTYAVKLPMGMIGDLLGVPRDDLDGLQPHVRIAIGNLDVRAPSLEQFSAAYDAGQLVGDYFRELIAFRHTDPGDDLLSQLVHIEEEGDRLTEPELISLVLLLFGAGFETTTNLIGNGLRALLLHPDQLARLRDDRSLLPTAIEEMLRWDSPVQVTGRGTIEPCELLGHDMPEGSGFLALLGAACRDPRKYDDPDRFDIGRVGAAQPMSFGGGIHYCLGAPLARLEGQLAFDRLLDRFRVIQPAWTSDSPPRYRDSTILRGLETLPVDLLAA
jgi:cytochrome P450